MQAALVSDGKNIPYVNDTGGSLTVGTLIVIGALLALLKDAGQGTTGPNTTLANAASGTISIDGVVEAPKVASAGACKAGQAAFWDATNSRFTPLAAGGVFGGVFAADATDAATRCLVKLNQPASAMTDGQELVVFGPIDAAASGDNAFFTPAADMRLVRWDVVSRDTGAANVKLRRGSTDITAVVAKGTANDAMVAGSTIVAAEKKLLKGVPVLINLSAAQAVEVTAYCVRTRA